MAISEVRRLAAANEAVQVFVTYDVGDGVWDADIETYRVVWDLPPGVVVTVNIYRLSSGRVWRTTELSGQGEWSDTAPFGPVKKVDELSFEVVVS